MSNLLRSLHHVSEIRKDKENELTRMWNISNSDPDMHRTVIPVEKWDLEFFNRSGAFYYQHITDGVSHYVDVNPDVALGPARAKVEGKNLVGIGTFEPEEKNELAGKIMYKVDYGTMRMTSVGFVPTAGGYWGVEERGQDPELYYFDGQRLLEFSCVHIGSNLGAESKSMDSMDQYLLKEIDLHPSKAYQRDFKRFVSHKNNKSIFVPETVEERTEIDPNKKIIIGDDRADLVRENRLFINQKFLENV